MNNQLEFCDIQRDRTRPPGGGQVVDGLWVYNTHAQSLAQVAYTLGKTAEHVRHLIDQGAFPNVRDVSSDTAAKACYVITREDVLAYMRATKIAAFKR
jgi:hypothetical protein